jgi:uncharacterized protein (DUF1501 family)
MVLASAATEDRFVFIIQRGAADGLNTVIPHGDPAYEGLRVDLAISPSEALNLDAYFSLHPSLTNLALLYEQKQALFVHAVASHYRDRSHFDGQNVLETGGLQPYAMKDGWLNRLVGLMPGSNNSAIALSTTVPTALRGRFSVNTHAPSHFLHASDVLVRHVGQLYRADMQLHPLWTSALNARATAHVRNAKWDSAGLGTLAATFLSQANGPRIAMLETSGWDTHTAQMGRLAGQLSALDNLLHSLQEGLGPYWSRTSVLIATEFGRTAAVNGTGGTDHGTGSVVILAGGAVKGGRVLTDWPGLAPSQLHEGRDLKPTRSLHSVIAGAVAGAFRLDPQRTARALFPSTAEPPIEGLTG